MFKNFLISDSFAQTSEAFTTAAQPGFSFSSFVPLILIFAVFYFLIVRPQTKKMKEHQALIDNLKIGSKVITNGGIIGVVKDVHKKENQVEVEISAGVNVRILKNYVADLVRDEKAENAKEKPVAKSSNKRLK